MYSHYEIANFPDSDLRDIFLQVSSEMNIPPSLVEKDFWVSLMLKYLYSDSPWKHSLLFKGGTSLSKCYRVIHRFSEDIDLLLDWREIGYPKEGPEQEKTRKKQEQSNDQLMAKTEMFLIEHMRPRMKSDLDKILKKEFEIETIGSNIVFRYPCAFDTSTIKNEILMEIGPRGLWGLPVSRNIQSYVAERLPKLCGEQIGVRALSLERTFCEKLVILHTVACREKVPERYSRHYYDVSCIHGYSTLSLNLDLVKEIAVFKSRFFPGASYGYNLASNGILKLVPPESVRSALRKDYGLMADMIFGNPPDFDDILKDISKLETELGQIKYQP